MGSFPGAIFQTPLTDVSLVQRDPLGSHRFENEKVYKYVQLKNTTATVAAGVGSLVGYGAADGYATSLVVVDLSDADTIPLGAGATLAAITGTAGTTYYCWIQIMGSITIDTAVTGAAIGKSFFLGSAAADKTALVGANAYDAKMGLSVSATTKVLLTCPW